MWQKHIGKKLDVKSNKTLLFNNLGILACCQQLIHIFSPFSHVLMIWNNVCLALPATEPELPALLKQETQLSERGGTRPDEGPGWIWLPDQQLFCRGGNNSHVHRAGETYSHHRVGYDFLTLSIFIKDEILQVWTKEEASDFSIIQ